jgi:hypothetical protein
MAIEESGGLTEFFRYLKSSAKQELYPSNHTDIIPGDSVECEFP